MTNLINDDKALFTFLKSALERGAITIKSIKTGCCGAKMYEIHSDLFQRDTFTVGLTVRYDEHDNPVDLILERIISMMHNDLIALK